MRRFPMRRFPYRVCALLAGRLASCFPLLAQPAPGLIQLNQVGFYPLAPKRVVVIGAAGNSFYVARLAGAAVIFRGQLGPRRRDTLAQRTVPPADFSACRDTGTFVLTVPGAGTRYRSASRLACPPNWRGPPSRVFTS